MYNAALFLHLLGVALLVGSVTVTLLTLLRVHTAGTVRELRSLIAGTKWVEVVIIPAMLLVVAPGLYMVSQHGDDGSIPWSAGWVVTSLVITLLLAILGPTVEASDDRRLRAAIASASGERPHADLREVQLASRPVYVVFFGTSQVVALLFLMTNRPGLAVAIAVCAVAAAASTIAASMRIRSVRRAEHAPLVNLEA
ncbi:DUF2269 family protein [Leekyejoonella antrihumi]|uniref:DUF2269 family protein n=1 Tax=Leekyejoonella antrihumi TaxID=1660198 RepID=A0A563DYI3_9MICO|nr:DUF2269 family protein [Leekyejoonella antrihumi]TWP35277.1 DUF2269 family protein [Leekyejoonella antrihumi]